MKDALKATLSNVLESIKDIVTRLSYSDWIALNGQIYYRKKNGFVILKANSGGSVTISSETLVGTLPSGYRPDQQLDFAASAMGGNSVILCRVETDGRIRMWASPSTRYWSFCVTLPLGGVLRNAVIAMLSAISEIGGGLNENDDKSIASECIPCIASQGDHNGNDYKQWGITYSFISDIKADNRGTYNEHTSPDYLQKRCVVSDGRKCWGRMDIFALCKSGGDADCVDNRIVTSERRWAA